MKKAVIYARYSSDRQNEQSIAGQVDVCTKWAKNNDMEIMHIYHDEALSGKTDKRPDFQQMIEDAKSGKSDYILVYKLDLYERIVWRHSFIVKNSCNRTHTDLHRLLREHLI